MNIAIKKIPTNTEGEGTAAIDVSIITNGEGSTSATVVSLADFTVQEQEKINEVVALLASKLVD